MSGAGAVPRAKANAWTFERRREARRDCSVVGRVKTAVGEFPCVISDLAPHGLRLAVTAAAELGIGELVTVSAVEIGSVAGGIRWTAHPRYGFALAQGQEPPAPMLRFYDSLSSERQLEERLKFLEMDEATMARLTAVKTLLDAAMPRCLDAFYDRVRSNPTVKSFFRDDAHIEHARSRQLGHWEEVTSGAFDGRYLERVRRIGFTHARIGLEPRWYIGGYAHILSEIARVIIADHWPKSWFSGGSKRTADDVAATVEATIKAVFLEMDLAIATYLHTSEEQRLKSEEEAIDLERSLVVNSIGGGLAKFAEKDLSYRMKDSLPSAYRKLQDDFNAAAEYLEDALQQVSGTADGVRTGMEEISAASDNLSHRTEQQAANLEETVAAIKELKSAAQKTSEVASQAHVEMDAAQEDAQRSGEVVRRTVTTMNKIAVSSREINQIISVVDEIAFQTNLLALNAGVEAARAGEVGRGFAVVASEVRALAQRSSEAAKEIRALIETSTTHVDTGVVEVAAAGAALERIAAKVTSINAGISDIARFAEDQATGLREVSSAVDEMDLLTQQNAAMAEQATAAALSLRKETEQLSNLIGEFKIAEASRVVGEAAPPPAPRRSAAA